MHGRTTYVGIFDLDVNAEEVTELLLIVSYSHSNSILITNYVEAMSFVCVCTRNSIICDIYVQNRNRQIGNGRFM